mgnify:CR=1 FL=1
MGLLSRKKPPLIGLDISSTAVKLLELSETNGRYRVESYAVEPLPANSVVEKNIADVEAVGESIRRAVKRAGAKATDAAVAISGDAAITKVIQMPSSLSERDLEGQVEIQADQYIPFPMEEVSYDFEVLGPTEHDPDMQDVLLVAREAEHRLDVPLVPVLLGVIRPAVHVCARRSGEMGGSARTPFDQRRRV